MDLLNPAKTMLPNDPSEYGIVLLAYLIGSIPFSLMLAKIAGIGDIRTQGSGNVGATNVLRTGGKLLGVIALALDAGKAAFAVYLAQQYATPMLALLCAIAAVLGHIFPVWLKFKGGRGVAATLGVLCIIHWPLGVGVIGTWLVAFAITRVSSLSALLAMFTAPTLALYQAHTLGYEIVYVTIILSIIVVLAHKSNIQRLLHGEESKLL